jgi:asparagine synthase (glutamine-hydrolysing)
MKKVGSKLNRILSNLIYTPMKWVLTKRRYSKQVDSIRFVLENSLTYLDKAALLDLFLAVKSAEQLSGKGAIIEAGCALGGSAIVIASAKDKSRIFQIYDTFGLIPPPSANDENDSLDRYDEIISGSAQGIEGNTYYGYVHDLQSQVKHNFQRAGLPVNDNQIELISGLFEDKLQPDEPVILAHLDCDWYDSVLVCLERIVPNLVSGGILVIDDYDHWAGCRKAVDYYFSDKMSSFEFIHNSRLHIRKRL